MKNSLLAVTVLTLCSVGFAQVPRLPRAARQSNQQQQAAALQAKKDGGLVRIKREWVLRYETADLL